jgi:hypothetical protein
MTLEEHVSAAVTITDLIAFVLNQADPSDLDALRGALSKRDRTLQEITAAAVKPGVEVTLQRISPKYLVGLTGTVKSISERSTRRAVVTLDKRSTQLLALASTRFRIPFDADSYDLSGVPVTACVPVAS